MYGTIARVRVKSDHVQQLQAMNDVWTQERGRQIDGFVASYVLRPDERPDELILVANPDPLWLERGVEGQCDLSERIGEVVYQAEGLAGTAVVASCATNGDLSHVHRMSGRWRWASLPSLGSGT